MASPYSTKDEFRANVPKLTVADYSDAAVDVKIAQADKIIEQDLSNLVDFSIVPNISASPATPDCINLLSQYKTAELCLTAKFGAKRDITEVSDIQYWQRMYSNPNPGPNEDVGLLQKIMNGQAKLELSDGTTVSTGINKFTRTARPNTEPALGLGERAEFLNDDEIYDERPERT